MGDAQRPFCNRRIVHSMPFLVLGEALVDLICEQPADGIGDADAFVPHFGGAAATVAVNAARAGGSVALAGGAGQDPMGWDPSHPDLRAAPADATEAGARATESWGALA
jgi:hypothetical protein